MQDPKVLSIAESRQPATEVVREIEETKIPVIVTRHGTPVVEIRPVKLEAPSPRGTLTFSPDYDPSAPAVPPDDWEAA